MERRRFLQKSFLGGLALGLLSNNVLFANSSAQTMVFDVPKASKHIRHGLFQNQSLNLVNCPFDWINHLQKDVFCQDGIDLEAPEFVHLSFKLENKLMNVGLCKNSLYITDELVTEERDLNNSGIINTKVYEDKTVQIIQLKKGQKHKRKIHNTQICLLPIKGEILIDNHLLTDEQGIFVQNQNKLFFEAQREETIVLLVGKNSLQNKIT